MINMNIKNYLDERDRVLPIPNVQGPVITISRSFGCNHEAVVGSLISKLNDLGVGGLKSHPWTYIDKEIIEEAASDLGMKTIDVEHRVLLHHSAVVTDLLSGFSQYYSLSDKTIIDDVKSVISGYAERGNVIIIGRGGVGVTRSIRNSVHVRLTAPLEYRAEVVAKANDINKLDAIAFIQRVDRDRRLWAEHLLEQKIDDSIFDLTFSMQSLRVSEITDIIINLMQKREMVPRKLKRSDFVYAV